MKSIRQAFVIADNLSNPTAFHPICINSPVSLLPLVNKPIIDYCLETLISASFNDINVLTQSNYSEIQEYFNSKWSHKHGVAIKVHNFPDAKTTGDLLRNVNTLKVEKQFLLASANIVTNIDLLSIMAKHSKNVANFKDLALTLIFTQCSPQNITRQSSESPLIGVSPFTGQLLYYSNDVQKATADIPLGLLKTSSSDKTINLCPNGRVDVFSNIIETGLMIGSPSFLQHFTDEFDSKTIEDYISHVLSLVENPDEPDINPLLKGIIFTHIAKNSYCSNITNWRTFHTCSHDIIRGWVSSFSLAHRPGSYQRLSNYVYCDSNVQLKYNTNLQSDVVLGRGCSIGENSTLWKVVIDNETFVAQNTAITTSYIFNNTIIGANCVINGAVIGKNVVIGNNVVIHKGALIGDNVVIDDNVVIPSYTSITAQNTYTSEEKNALRLELRRVCRLLQYKKYTNISYLQTTRQNQQIEANLSNQHPSQSLSSPSLSSPIAHPGQSTLSERLNNENIISEPCSLVIHATPEILYDISTIDQFPIDPFTFYYNHESEPELLARQINLNTLSQNSLVEYSLSSYKDVIAMFGSRAQVRCPALSATAYDLSLSASHVITSIGQYNSVVYTFSGQQNIDKKTTTTTATSQPPFTHLSTPLRQVINPLVPVELISSSAKTSSATVPNLDSHFPFLTLLPTIASALPKPATSSSASAFSMTMDDYDDDDEDDYDDESSDDEGEDDDDLYEKDVLLRLQDYPRIMLPDLITLQADTSPHPIYTKQSISSLLVCNSGQVNPFYQSKVNVQVSSPLDNQTTLPSSTASNNTTTTTTTTNNNNNTQVFPHSTTTASGISTLEQLSPVLSAPLPQLNTGSVGSDSLSTKSKIPIFTSKTAQNDLSDHHQFILNQYLSAHNNPQYLPLPTSKLSRHFTLFNNVSQSISQYQSISLTRQFPYYPLADLTTLSSLSAETVVGKHGYGRIFLHVPHPAFGRAGRLSNSIVPPFYLSLRNYAPLCRSHVLSSILDDIDIESNGFNVIDPTTISATDDQNNGNIDHGFHDADNSNNINNQIFADFIQPTIKYAKDTVKLISSSTSSVSDIMKELPTTRLRFAHLSHDVLLCYGFLGLFYQAGYPAPNLGIWKPDLFGTNSVPPPWTSSPNEKIRLDKLLNSWLPFFQSSVPNPSYASSLLLPSLFVACSLNTEYHQLLLSLLGAFWSSDVITTADIDTFYNKINNENKSIKSVGANSQSFLPALLHVTMPYENFPEVKYSPFDFVKYVIELKNNNQSLPDNIDGIEYHDTSKLLQKLTSAVEYIHNLDDEDEDEDEYEDEDEDEDQ